MLFYGCGSGENSSVAVNTKSDLKSNGKLVESKNNLESDGITIYKNNENIDIPMSQSNEKNISENEGIIIPSNNVPVNIDTSEDNSSLDGITFEK